MPRRSRPVRPEYGPSWPNTVIRAHTSRGSQSSGPMCQRSTVPGRKFSHTTSAVAASRRNRSWPSGVRRLQGDALAAPSLDRPPQRVAGSIVVGRDERTDGAHEVAARRVLDLDDLGAHVAEQPGAERRADPGADVDDPDAFEGAVPVLHGSSGAGRSQASRVAHWSPSRAGGARAHARPRWCAGSRSCRPRPTTPGSRATSAATRRRPGCRRHRATAARRRRAPPWRCRAGACSSRSSTA